MTDFPNDTIASPATDQTQPPVAKPGMQRRWMLAILVVTFLFVAMPFLFWQATWFGKPLTPEDIQKALANQSNSREIQHALSQIADRILSPDTAIKASARQFYPAVTRVAETGSPELRLTAAWVMGQDNTVVDFHEHLLRLLRDGSPMVRRNAALSLVRFNDPAGHDEIRELLAPYSMLSPFAGMLNSRLKTGDAINPGTLLGHIQSANGDEREIRADVPGEINRWLVSDGKPLVSGEPLVLIDPSPVEVFEALRALYLIGQPQDLPAIELFARSSVVPENIRQQARDTAAAIRSRQ
jgi:biotin carboxyl carrier protein